MRHVGILRLLAYITAITMLAALALLVRAPAQELEQESSHPVLLSIAVIPADPSILPDRRQRFTATGTYSDGRTRDLTRRVTWSSSALDVATINHEGHAWTLAEGQTTIAAVLGTIDGSTTLNVTRFVWTRSMGTTRLDQTATVLNNGLVLIAGGFKGWNFDPSSSLSSAELYNPATGTFTHTGSLSTARSNHTATLLNNGTVLIVGGAGCCDTHSQSLASAELYNPATGNFSYTTGSLNTARDRHTATLLNNGMVLITSGEDNGEDLASAELYDPATGTFTPTGSMNTARQEAMATLLNDGMVLVAGGETFWTGGFIASAELYNPATGTFTYTTGNMNSGRAEFTATLLNNGMVLMAGGFWDNNSAELYDPASGTFTPTGSMNTSREEQRATLLNNGMVLVAGGYTALASAELYDPVAASFSYTDSMNTSRALQSSTLLNNGMVLVAGGHVGYNVTVQASAELYEPATRTPTDLESIAVTPERSTLSPGETQRFIATGTFRNGSTQQLASVTWTSFNPAVAQISNDASNRGVGLTIKEGTVIIMATAGHVRGRARLTVQ